MRQASGDMKGNARLSKQGCAPLTLGVDDVAGARKPHQVALPYHLEKLLGHTGADLFGASRSCSSSRSAAPIVSSALQYSGARAVDG